MTIDDKLQMLKAVYLVIASTGSFDAEMQELATSFAKELGLTEAEIKNILVDIMS